MTDNTKAKSLKDYNESILPQLQDICEPLKIFDISNFAYGKITKDQKFLRVGTHEGYSELFLNMNFIIELMVIEDFSIPSPFQKKKVPYFFYGIQSVL